MMFVKPPSVGSLQYLLWALHMSQEHTHGVNVFETLSPHPAMVIRWVFVQGEELQLFSSNRTLLAGKV